MDQAIISSFERVGCFHVDYFLYARLWMAFIANNEIYSLSRFDWNICKYYSLS